ncbi:hypothetical protein GCM10010404_71560 [Nonomuraea africana]|uniref:Outer membrane channel protein CpnT-like N-terminal domain-containing protein n=1 Tax=Nonomuraea africana TaxID=46171 RepID=A0ABR9KP84_9ACTN|nr:hypothetical protein [Nonomuraea africana]MBE1563841.1 hypothetical protein [Nonomuraea africana]
MRINPGRASIFAFGTLGMAGFVFQMLAVDYPEGDPAKAREARDVWARLAERIEQSPNRTYPSAEAVWKRNEGDGVAAFKSAVTEGLYPQPPVMGHAAQLARRCRQNSAACEDYAEVVEAAQHAYWTLALANFASFVFISTFPWQAGVASEITKILMRREQAKLLAKLLEHNIARILMSKLTEYSIGSAFFAVGDVSVVAGVKALRGDDVGSVEDNAKQALKEFAASVVFYGVSDAASPAISALSKNADVQGFLGRMAGGSIGYGPAYDAMNGQTGEDLIPTWKETLGRALLYFTMAHKPPG